MENKNEEVMGTGKCPVCHGDIYFSSLGEAVMVNLHKGNSPGMICWGTGKTPLNIKWTKKTAP